MQNTRGAAGTQPRMGMGKNVQCAADQQQRYNESGSDSGEFPGAYRKQTKVLALMRDNETWKLSEIYEVRHAKFVIEDVYDDEEDSSDSNDEVSVLDHPVKNTAQENKKDYFKRYLEEFREMQRMKDQVTGKKGGGSREESNPSGDQAGQKAGQSAAADVPPELENNQNSSEKKGEPQIQDKIEEELNEEDKELEKSMRYEYYVHYLGIDRRLDRWVTEQFILVDPEEIHNQESLISAEEEERALALQLEKEKQYMFNDENHGMKEREVQIFLNQTKIKTVESIHFGKHWLETWYFTALPHEYHTKCLYICDFCLSFFVHKNEFKRHSKKCTQRHPPGDEFYRDKDIAFFEVNGSSSKIYAENLSYISRMFLDHKNVNNTIEGFFFYVLCDVQDDGYHFVGYFSKEKFREENQNNLSCIMVMPFVQRGGYGKTLIEMSYALGMIENKPGGPERPLSDLGHRTYVSFWTRRVIKVLLDVRDGMQEVSMKQLVKLTGMTESDIRYILDHQKILREEDSLNCDKAFLESILKFAGTPGRPLVFENIRWKPYYQLSEQRE